MKTSKYLIFASLQFLMGCSNNSVDDLTEPVVFGTTTYIQNIKPIIDNNCINCHSATPTNGAPMPLITYAQVKDAVLNRGLLDRISSAQGAQGMMPNQGIRLPQTAIDLISDWNTDGLIE